MGAPTQTEQGQRSDIGRSKGIAIGNRNQAGLKAQIPTGRIVAGGEPAGAHAGRDQTVERIQVGVDFRLRHVLASQIQLRPRRGGAEQYGKQDFENGGMAAREA
jgi:hypothetical protein